MFFGSAYLLWCFRSKLLHIAIAYGFCYLALLLKTGALNCVNRYVYAIVPYQWR